MSPHPGDRHRPPSTPMEQTESNYGYDPGPYSAIFDMSDDTYEVDEKALQAAVLRCKEKADRLRAAGYPMFHGSSKSSNFDSSLRAEAAEFDEFLDQLITLESIESATLWPKLRILIAQGDTFDKFKQKMRDLDYSLKCSMIWESDSVAYRCNTCALTPCMSLCAECFQSNGHEGHDFTRFFSREGGACDCGNTDVMLAEGSCHRHGEASILRSHTQNRCSAVDVVLPEYIMMKLFVRFFINFRGFWDRYLADRREAEEDVRGIRIPLDYATYAADFEVAPVKWLISFLQECVNYGGPMRQAMSRVLLDEDLYTALTERTSEVEMDSPSVIPTISLDWRSERQFEADKASLISDRCREMFPCTDDPDYLKCSSLLDELIFWIIRLNYPQSIINLSLSVLSEPDYMEAFSLRFFSWYPVVASSMRDLCIVNTAFEQARNDLVQATGNRVVHISVQMLSSGFLCEKLNKSCDLVQNIIRAVHFLMTDSLTGTKITMDPMMHWCQKAAQLENLEIDWQVISLENHTVMSQHGYWFVMGDIQNLLSHSQIAMSAIAKGGAFHTIYIQLISAMQGMGLNWRIVSGEHLELDNGEPIHRSFTLEFETLAITMFNFVNAIRSAKDKEAAFRFFYTVITTLKKWLSAIFGHSTGDIRSCPPYSVTFHIPLHRHLSTALTHFWSLGVSLAYMVDFLTDEATIRKILLHPMRIQAARSEFAAGMWVRNGHSMRVQAVLYAQAHINLSFHTPDVDLIQICASYVKKDWFIASLMESFHLFDVFEIEPLTEALLATTKSPLGEDSVPDTRWVGMQDCVYIKNSRRGLEEVRVRDVEDEEEDGGSRFRRKPAQNKRDPWATVDVPMSHDDDVDEVGEEAMEGGPGFPTPEEVERQQRLASFEKLCSSIRDAQYAPARLKVLISALTDGTQVANDECDQVKPTRLRCRWLGEDSSRLLRREDWIDHLVYGSLLLLAEIMVVRTNTGASEEESIRVEMVNELASESLPFSRLRASIAEKGSRGGPMVDQRFENILKQIAEYEEPDAGDRGQMRQGTYVLKQDTWLNEFCPVICQMRSLSNRQCAFVLRKIENLELSIPVTCSNPLKAKEGNQETRWIPYRLYDLRQPRPTRMYYLRNQADLLLSDRFIQYALCVIVAYKKYSWLRDTCLQLVIYLLTIGAEQLASSFTDEVMAEETLERFMRKYDVITEQNGEPSGPPLSLFSVLYNLLMSETAKRKSTREVLENILEGSYARERIFGGIVEYLARFFCCLCRSHSSVRLVFVSTLKDCLEENEPQQEAVDEESEARVRQKAEAKRRREAMLEATRRRSQAVMAKLMNKEGMTQEQMDDIDTFKPDVRLYECPICGDLENPSTLKSPMGMLVQIDQNFVSDLCIPSSQTVPPLAGMDEEKSNLVRPKIAWMRSRNVLTLEQPLCFYGDLAESPMIGLHLKTCGHTAHIDCFNTYRSTLHNDHLRVLGPDPSREAVSCPLCRFQANALLPMAIDQGFATLNRMEDGESPEAQNEKAFDAIATCIMHWKKSLTSNEEECAYSEHYTIHFSAIESSILHQVQDWEGDGNNYTSQTTLVAIIKTHVERNLVLNELNVPASRKDTRRLAIEHLIPAALAKTTQRERDACLGALRDLFNAHGSWDSEDVVSSDDELDDILPTVDEMISKVEKGSEEQPIEGFSQEDWMALQSTSQSSPSSRRAPSPQNYQEQFRLLKSSGKLVPLLHYDLRSLFVRICIFVLDNCSLSIHDKSLLCLILIQRFLIAAAAKASVMLLLRTDRHTLVRLALSSPNSEKTIHERLLCCVAHCLSTGESQFEAMLSHLGGEEGSQCITESQMVSQLSSFVHEFNQFTCEFMQSTSLVSSPVMVDENSSVGVEDATILRWIQDYYSIIGWNFKSSTKPLCMEPLSWRPFVMLDLPAKYDALLTMYFGRCCVACGKAPTNPFICLRCSKLVCPDDCCKSLGNNEVEKHSVECGLGCCVFLALNSSLLVVVNGIKGIAGVWGSAYLDAHGEEDRNLRRGKPLFLSAKRVSTLRNDWAERDWNGRVTKWFAIQTLIMQMRDIHMWR